MQRTVPWLVVGGGAVLWFIARLDLVVPDPLSHQILQILLVAPFVLVPLALAILAERDRQGRFLMPWAAAVVLGAAGLVSLVIAVRLPIGIASGAWASVWLLETVALAVLGLTRFLRRGFQPWEESWIDVGLLFVPVGGVWLVLSRAGIEPMGFGYHIVILTAVHFHFAGLIAPMTAGLAGRILNGRWRAFLGVAATSIIVGIPLVAFGITTSPLAELGGATVLALGMLALGVTLIFGVSRHAAPGPRVLLWISGAALPATMALAFVFALGEFRTTGSLSFGRMVALHGAGNAFGFAFCGLVAWTLIRPPPRRPPAGIPLSQMYGGLRIGADYFERNLAVDPAREVTGIIEDLSLYRRDGFDPSSVAEVVRDFYEHTDRYDLSAVAQWQAPFRLGGRLFRGFANRIQQLGLPLGDDAMTSNLFAVSEAADGRDAPRAWVRTFTETGDVLYVAAYSVHRVRDVPYMNIAFPIPAGTFVSVLRMDPPHLLDKPAGGLTLTTRFNDTPGDEGIYFGNRVIPIRLPFDETITLWPEGSSVRATHYMWVFGLHFLTLQYDIVRKS